MKKTTLFIIFLLSAYTFSSVNAQNLVWKGKQTDQIWSTAVANWQEGVLPIPKAWADNAVANFDETATAGSDTIVVNGVINTSGININNTRTYVIRKSATDTISGTGTLIKDGAGDFVMDITNKLTGGCVVKAGRLKMEKQASPNIFGSKIEMQGGIVNFATTSSSSYPSITVPMTFVSETNSTVELSRYSYWASPISGSGNMLIKAGGERTYFGLKNVAPNLTNYSGNITIDKYVMDGVKPGYYGLVLNTSKTFDATTLDLSGVDSTLYNKKVNLATDIVLTSESGTRCYAIGELTATDNTNLLCGYYKNSTTPSIYYMVGGLNTDVNFPGTFGDKGAKGYNSVGFIKVGTGTYTFTSPVNVTGVTGVIVKGGKFYINSSETAPTVSALGRTKGNILDIRKNAIGGGNGRLTGTVDVSGKLEIGYKGIGTIVVSDTISRIDGVTIGTYNYPVKLRSSGVAEFEIASASSYDKLIVNNQVRFFPDTVATVISVPTIKVIPSGTPTINNGDKFELISWKGEKLPTDSFKVEFAGFDASVTWAYEIVQIKDISDVVTDSKLVATATVGTGVKQHEYDKNISIYPNPSKGTFAISSQDMNIDNVEIFNIQGQLVYKKSVKGEKINIEGLKSGFYPVKVTLENGKQITQKITVK